MADMERHAIQLMVPGTMNPKVAMDISGCRYEVGSKDYNRLYQKDYRKRQNMKKTRNAKRIKSLDQRNKKLSKKNDSIQQLKRAVNDAVAQSTQSLVKQRGMQRQLDKLQKRQEATTLQLRAVALDNVVIRKKASKTKVLAAKLGFI